MLSVCLINIVLFVPCGSDAIRRRKGIVSAGSRQQGVDCTLYYRFSCGLCIISMFWLQAKRNQLKTGMLTRRKVPILTYWNIRRGGWWRQNLIVFWQHHLLVWAERVLAAVGEGGGGVGGGACRSWEWEPLHTGRGTRWSWTEGVSGWQREDKWDWGFWFPVDEHDLDGSSMAA